MNTDKLFDLAEYRDIAQDDEKCWQDLMENTIEQMERFLEKYTLALRTKQELKFRDNIHRMMPVFTMLQMKKIMDLSQEGRKLLLQNSSVSDAEIEAHLLILSPIVLEIIHELKIIPLELAHQEF